MVVKRIPYDYSQRIESIMSKIISDTVNNSGFNQKKNEKGEQKCIKNSIF